MGKQRKIYQDEPSKPLQSIYEELKGQDVANLPDNIDEFRYRLDTDQSISQKIFDDLSSKGDIINFPGSHEEFREALGLSLKKKDASSLASSDTSEGSELQLDAPSAQVAGALGDDSSSELEMERNPLKTFGKSAWNVLSNQLPSSGAAAGAAAIGNARDVFTMAAPEMASFLQNDRRVAKEGIAEIERMSKMYDRLQKGLDQGQISQEDFESQVSPMVERATFLMDEGFTEFKKDGFAKAQEELLKYAVKKQEEGAEYTADLINSTDKVQDPIDALNWMSNAVGQTSAQIIPAIATLGTSAFAQEIGSIYLGSVQKIAQERGITVEEVIERQLDDPAVATAHGIGAAALENLGAGKVASSLTKKMWAESLRRRATSFIKSGNTEALTEGAQTIIEQHGEAMASDTEFDVDWKEVGEAWAQGWFGGGVLNTAGDIISEKINKPKKDESNTIQEATKSEDKKPSQEEKTEETTTDSDTAPVDGNTESDTEGAVDSVDKRDDESSGETSKELQEDVEQNNDVDEQSSQKEQKPAEKPSEEQTQETENQKEVDDGATENQGDDTDSESNQQQLVEDSAIDTQAEQESKVQQEQVSDEIINEVANLEEYKSPSKDVYQVSPEDVSLLYNQSKQEQNIIPQEKTEDLKSYVEDGKLKPLGKQIVEDVETRIQPEAIKESKDATGKDASWVIKDKNTGEVILETFEKKTVEKINKDKYEAVPIGEHLASLNKKQAPVEARFDEPQSTRLKEGVKVTFAQPSDLSGKKVSLGKVFETDDTDMVSASRAQNILKEKYKNFRKLNKCINA